MPARISGDELIGFDPEDSREAGPVIPEDVFSACYRLQAVTIPPSVWRIGRYAVGYYLFPVDPWKNTYEPRLTEKIRIIGARGSEAERYAERNGIPFTAGL